jgi:hypothetical protein
MSQGLSIALLILVLCLLVSHFYDIKTSGKRNG